MAAEGYPLLRLIAGSEGATLAMVDAALAVPQDAQIGTDAAILLYALATRARRDTSSYAEHIRGELREDGTTVVAFLDAIRRGEDPAQADQKLTNVSMDWRLHARYAAVVMLGADAPASWRDEVQRGLFVGERGYIARRVSAPRSADGRTTPDDRGTHPATILSSPGG
jgi:hypothetical protein